MLYFYIFSYYTIQQYFFDFPVSSRLHSEKKPPQKHNGCVSHSRHDIPLRSNQIDTPFCVQDKSSLILTANSSFGGVAAQFIAALIPEHTSECIGSVYQVQRFCQR